MVTKSLVFMSLTGDVFMTLNTKETRWSSILEKIVIEEWYQNYEKWSFVFDSKNLEPDYVFKSEDAEIKITCIKIVEPHITFELPSGKFLVSVPFSSCKIWHSKHVYLINACCKAHEKLLKLGKNGYGTGTNKVYPFPLNYTSTYIFRNKKGERLYVSAVLEVPEDDNLIIVAIPKSQYCNRYCEIKFQGPLRIGEERKFINRTLCICPNCGFFHCLSCQTCKSCDS